MMKTSARLLKAATFLAILIAAGFMLTCYADPATEGPVPDINLRDDAPIYKGPVEEADLEALTADDYESFGTNQEESWKPYDQYRKVLKDPPPGILLPYRMKIVDRDLTLDDFVGIDVPEDLATARYQSYCDMDPDTVDGRTIHYVFVYHRPLQRAGAEFDASGN
jgi:hypothetical protein